MSQVFIGLGSNLGDRLNYLHLALGLLDCIKGVCILKYSSVYETQPIGIKEQPKFLNMAVELKSELPPYEIFNNLKKIEKTLGRTNAERWGPREIDLDLLYYDDKVVDDGKLCIPHPEIINRKFVLVPMKEIAAGFQDPARHLSIEDMLRSCPDVSEVSKIDGSLCLQR